MLLQRIVTVAVLLPLFLAALFFLPNLYWGLLLAGLLVLAGTEWGRLAGYSRKAGVLFCTVLAGAAAGILWWEHTGEELRTFVYSPAGKVFYGMAAAFWLGIAPAWLLYRWRVRAALPLAIVGCLVLLPFWHALVWLQQTPSRLLMALCVVWVADTAAYFVGRRFGRHKLAPEVSPGKTWEGVWGALAAVAIYWIAVSALLPEYGERRASGLAWVALMMMLSIVGDLFESWMKREAGVKDSGRLLPGHGGILDRVDGLSATLPLAALYFAFPLTGA
jgi:phosphatidate cytidylyltransferase